MKIKSHLGRVTLSIYIAGLLLFSLFSLLSGSDSEAIVIFAYPWLMLIEKVAETIFRNELSSLGVFAIVLSLLINVFLAYYIGVAIEKLIKRRKTQPPNQGQSPKIGA